MVDGENIVLSIVAPFGARPIFRCELAWLLGFRVLLGNGIIASFRGRQNPRPILGGFGKLLRRNEPRKTTLMIGSPCESIGQVGEFFFAPFATSGPRYFAWIYGPNVFWKKHKRGIYQVTKFKTNLFVCKMLKKISEFIPSFLWCCFFAFSTWHWYQNQTLHVVDKTQRNKDVFCRLISQICTPKNVSKRRRLVFEVIQSGLLIL